MGDGWHQNPLENKSHLGLIWTGLSSHCSGALGTDSSLLFFQGKQKKGRGLRKYKKLGFSLLGSAERFGVFLCWEKASPGALSAALALVLPHVKIQQNGNIQPLFSPGVERKWDLQRDSLNKWPKE